VKGVGSAVRAVQAGGWEGGARQKEGEGEEEEEEEEGLD